MVIKRIEVVCEGLTISQLGDLMAILQIDVDPRYRYCEEEELPETPTSDFVRFFKILTKYVTVE